MGDHRSLPLAAGSGGPPRFGYECDVHSTFYIHEDGQLLTRGDPVDPETN
jgi:hypothetical protein